LVYRQWLGYMIFPLGACFVIFNMVLIIHAVLAQRQRSDQYQLGSSGTENTCGSRLSRCFLLFTSSICKLFTAIKWCICRGNIGDTTNKVVTAVDNGILDHHHQEPSSSADLATNAVISNELLSAIADTLPSMQVCLKPVVRVLASPMFHNL